MSMDLSCPSRRKSCAAYRSMAKQGGQGLARARRARIPRMRRRRRQSRQVDVVPAQRQAQARRDGGVLVHRLQVARASRPRHRQGDEGQAPREDDGPQGDAVRRQAHDLSAASRFWSTPDVTYRGRNRYGARIYRSWCRGRRPCPRRRSSLPSAVPMRAPP